MNTRVSIAMAAAAGCAAAAHARQDLMRVSYSWTEVVGGTTTPVLSPNSILDPGEGALIGINLFATVNGANAIGQTTTYTPPPPPGVGTVRGIGSFFYTLNGTGYLPQGSWTSLRVSPLLNIANQIGTPGAGGATVADFGGGQFLPPGTTANETNPVATAWRGVWTPTSFAVRTVNFKATFSQAVGLEQCSGFMVNTGIAYLDPTDPTTAYPQYIVKYVDTDFGAGVNINLFPAPSGVWVLGGLGAWLGRRRR